MLVSQVHFSLNVIELSFSNINSSIQSLGYDDNLVNSSGISIDIIGFTIDLLAFLKNLNDSKCVSISMK